MAVIFLRKPKCAGTSIRSMLKQNVGALRPEQVHHYDRWDCCVIGAFEIELWEDQQWFKDAWKFTVIRNVWDRAISGWLHCPTLRKRPFADVVANPPQKSEDHYGWHHFARLQKEFLISPETGKLRANYVIPFEQLRPSLRVVWSKFGIQPPRMLHQNAGPSRHHYSHYFDDATLKRFNELFAEDICFTLIPAGKPGLYILVGEDPVELTVEYITGEEWEQRLMKGRNDPNCI